MEFEQAHTPSCFRFNGKIRYVCVIPSVTDEDGICIAIVPGFADGAMCEELIRLCEDHQFSAEERGSVYTQSTVDIEIDSAPLIRKWLIDRGLITVVSRCMMATHGSSPIAFDDVFVVKYDATGDSPSSKRGLELHSDAGDVSFMLALSPPEKYCGGGTYFDIITLADDFVNHGLVRDNTICLRRGELLLFDAVLMHSGRAISAGTRYLLVGFCFTKDSKTAFTPGNLDLNLRRLL